MKLDPTNSGPAVELISIGPLGNDNKLSGVCTWHRVPSFKNLEWSNVQIKNKDNDEEACWIEISDAARLIKIITSIIGMTASITDELVCDICILVTENEMILSTETGTTCSFRLPVQWFDSKWAMATFTFPPTSKPRACVKIVAGLDQLAVILKRADKWRGEEWAIDILSISVRAADDGGDGLWDVDFVAETSSPPNVSLKTTLPNCPVQQLNGISSFQSCTVSVHLGAATRALFVPLAENDRLASASSSSGISLLWIPGEALIGNVNWNAVGFGLVYTSIYIPSRLH